MTIPRQLACTMGPAHGGVEFLEGSFPGFREVREFLDQEKPYWKGLHLQSMRFVFKEKLGFSGASPVQRDPTNANKS